MFSNFEVSSSSTKSDLPQRLFLTRLLQTTGLSLTLITASAAGVRAEIVTVQGIDGANGANGVEPPGDPNGQPGGDGESVTANAGGHPITAPLNRATAIGGNGGSGGAGALHIDPVASGGLGGSGGGARASAATTINSGSAVSDAISVGGNGADGGFGNHGSHDSEPAGNGGPATALATGSSGSGPVVVSTSASGGSSIGSYFSRNGGDASASSTGASGSGGVLSTAHATGGDSHCGTCVGVGYPGSAKAMADASSAGGGAADARAVATGGVSVYYPFRVFGVANATSNAATVKGALAQAQSTAVGSSGQAQSTAKTSFPGVSVVSTDMAPTGQAIFFQGVVATATTNSIAQAGGAGQTFSNPGQTAFSFSTGLPDKAYATMLIDGASNVANALLGPRDQVFGAGILGANFAPNGDGQSFTYKSSSTFDFARPEGDLFLGLINGEQTGFAGGSGFQSMTLDIIANGDELFDTTFRSLSAAESFFHDDVLNLGSSLGPNVDLTVAYSLMANGPGGFALDFAVGGAVPESSTWAMLLLGFGGLGLVGYRQTRRAKLQAV